MGGGKKPTTSNKTSHQKIVKKVKKTKVKEVQEKQRSQLL